MTRLTHTQIKVFLSVALVSSLAANTQAAVIEVKPVVAGYFDTAYNPIPPFHGYPGGPVVVQVDVMMQVLSLAPGEDSFGSAVFSFDLDGYYGGSPIVPDLDAGGWYGNYVSVDRNGNAPGGMVELFATSPFSAFFHYL